MACWLRQVQGHSSASAPTSLGRGRVGGAPEWGPPGGAPAAPDSGPFFCSDLLGAEPPVLGDAG